LIKFNIPDNKTLGKLDIKGSYLNIIKDI
jgi:hypothetical protein